MKLFVTRATSVNMYMRLTGKSCHPDQRKCFRVYVGITFFVV
jgi:hypothetical protein